MSWLPKKRVLAPFDFSDLSVQAIETSLELVHDASHVHVLHVLPEMEVNEPGMVWGTVDNASRTRHAEAAMRSKLADPRFAKVQFAVRFGDPGHTIAEYAAALPADLIVIPSHGLQGLKRLLIGSVADRVVRLAKCPVLVIR